MRIFGSERSHLSPARPRPPGWWGARRILPGALLGISLLVAAAGCPAAPAAASPGPRVPVIVVALPGAERAAQFAVASLGGTVERRLGIIHGFSAAVPNSALEALRAAPGVAAVSPDEVLHAQGGTYAAMGSYDPVTDLGSMYNVTLMSGARQYWAAGYTGSGVDIALIDSGVAPVEGLTVPGKVVNGADLSFESQASNLSYMDGFGHGTHMAGIIAGRASAAILGSYTGDKSDFLGMAPDARIVSVKVADSHGATDVSQVIAGIDWVVQHKNDNGLNIRVLNLSYGTNSTQSWTVDPLAFAAEQAWKAGIFVVTAVGNAGFAQSKAGNMMDPAYDPNIFAVGATDPMGTLKLDDDKVASFSSTGSDARRPDLVAPGSHIVSLRVLGSLVDQTYSSTGAITDSLFRGSGTSQATAVASGAAALVISQRPTITPDRLKALLRNTTQAIQGSDVSKGKGELNLAKTLKAGMPGPYGWKNGATGTGSLDLSRGSTHVLMDGITLAGEQDVFGKTVVTATMASLEATAKSWSGGTWNANIWSGSDWSAKSWSGSTWSTTTWTAKSWSGSDWGSKSWSTMTWTTAGWSGGDWSANNWLAGDWANNVWADASWS